MPAFDPNQSPATERRADRTPARRTLDPSLYVGAIPSAKVRNGLVQIATGRRPELAWAEGLTGTITSIPRGGAFRVHLNDASGRLRAARVRVEDLESWP